MAKKSLCPISTEKSGHGGMNSRPSETWKPKIAG
jgi:hypothetical protein